MHSRSQSQCGPGGSTHRRPAGCHVHRHVVSAEITLISPGRMSLAVLGGAQPGMEGRRAGGVDVGGTALVGGGEVGGFGGLRGTADICIPPSSVTGRERWTGTGSPSTAALLAELWLRNQRCNVTRS